VAYAYFTDSGICHQLKSDGFTGKARAVAHGAGGQIETKQSVEEGTGQ
jgi:hypothetical protein